MPEVAQSERIVQNDDGGSAGSGSDKEVDVVEVE